MSDKNIHFKQEKLLNPQTEQAKVHVYGAGSIGSHVIMGLAKIGIKDITVYDFDTLEESNIPAQFYSINQAQKQQTKTESIKQLTESFTGATITTHNQKINENFNPEIQTDSVHILAFDNIEARKIIATKLNGFPTHLIDGRIGSFNYEKYYTRTDSDAYEQYLKTLEGEFTELQCGEKTLWAVNGLLASKIIGDVIKIIKKKTPSKQVKGNLMSEQTIVRK